MSNPFDAFDTFPRVLVSAEDARKVFALPHDAAHLALAETVIALHTREPRELRRLADALAYLVLRDTIEPKSDHRAALDVLRTRILETAKDPSR